ncbi:MAG: SDR family oxidoreductase [Pricia sp.]
MDSIENKTVWITGASSGIGEALAYELSTEGCRLVLSSRNRGELERVKAGCEHPEKVTVIPLDVTDFDALPEKMTEAVAAFGGIDVLINNAGISQRSLIEDTDFEVYRQLMDVNYLGTVALTKAVLPHFTDRKQGHFVTVSSLMGKFGTPLRSGYCGSKHALHGFFDVLRMEHEKDGIAVTIVCPGFIRTDIAKKALTGDGSPQQQEDNATQNGMPVQQCARKIVRAIKKEKFEVYIGGKETSGAYLKRIFPKLLHKIILRSKVT